MGRVAVDDHRDLVGLGGSLGRGGRWSGIVTRIDDRGQGAQKRGAGVPGGRALGLGAIEVRGRGAGLAMGLLVEDGGAGGSIAFISTVATTIPGVLLRSSSSMVVKTTKLAPAAAGTVPSFHSWASRVRQVAGRLPVELGILPRQAAREVAGEGGVPASDDRRQRPQGHRGEDHDMLLGGGGRRVISGVGGRGGLLVPPELAAAAARRPQPTTRESSRRRVSCDAVCIPVTPGNVRTARHALGRVLSRRRLAPGPGSGSRSTPPRLLPPRGRPWWSRGDPSPRPRYGA